MHEKVFSKIEIIKLIEKAVNSHCFVYSDKKWAYPWQGCNQKECTMLDMNFNIERQPGIVIHIPHKTLEDLEIKNLVKKKNEPLP